ncbi:unnamed protein product [Leptosia nina]|uniref:PROP1-like PPR domain-containing protein n=1 Tax=Leptosia nina TaxID=320188 RepID=A0AAV1K2X1_9NEOP
MASRCLNFVKILTKNKTYVSFVRQNLMSTTSIPNEKLNAAKEYKTENNITYLEDPDIFGTLSNRSIITDDKLEDEGDIQEENFLTNRPLKSQQFSTKQYADIIKQYLNNKRLKEALDILEVRMLKEDQVKPENYIYNILIGGCADSCINSPFKENGLKLARNLRNLMIEKGIEPNLTNYNVMIKAFGRCGDLPMAFKLIDEMIEKKIKIRVHTLNHLLHACISDKESGLRHALIVWRKMLKLREKPNIYSFNLMLRCVKECNLGTKDDIEELIDIIQETRLIPTKPQELQITAGDKAPRNVLLAATNQVNSKIDSNIEYNNDTITTIRNDVQTTESADILPKEITVVNENVTLNFVDKNNLPIVPKQSVPNLLSRRINLDQVCGLQEVHSVQEKFAIIGGQDDFLRQMEIYSVKPDIKTFTQMLSVIDDSIEAENKLLATVKAINLKPDIEFYNMLIKKRCLRMDYDNAFAVKDIIEEESKSRKRHPFNKKRRLKVDIMTYGSLAMACKTKEDAEKLLNEMKEKQLKVNIEILGTLLRHGTTHFKFGYIVYIMKLVKDDNLRVNNTFIKHLETFSEKCEKLVRQHNESQSDNYLVPAYARFKTFYCNWLKEVDIENALNIEDPWKQFKEPHPDTVQREKFKIIEPKRFYKRKPRYVRYVPRV